MEYSPPSTKAQLESVVDIKFIKQPIVIRMIVLTALGLLVPLIAIVITESMYDAGQIDVALLDTLDIIVIVFAVAVLAYVIFFELTKLVAGFMRFRFDFDNNEFTRYDFPRWRTRTRMVFWHRSVHTQVPMDAIVEVDDKYKKIRVSLSRPGQDMLFRSLTLNTKNLTWSHEEIYELMTAIVNRNVSKASTQPKSFTWADDDVLEVVEDTQ